MADFPFNPETANVSSLHVLEYCIQGFMESLGKIAAEYGKAPWKVVNVAGPQHFRELFRQQKNIKLPFLAVIVSSMRPNGESYNEQAAFNGKSFGIGPDGQQTVLHFRPILVDCTVFAVAQTLSDITDFSQRWLFREREMQFVLATEYYNLKIKVQFNPELAIPEEDFSEMGNMFTLQATANLGAYCGVMQRVPQITTIQVNTDAVANTTVIPVNTFEIKANKPTIPGE